MLGASVGGRFCDGGVCDVVWFVSAVSVVLASFFGFRLKTANFIDGLGASVSSSFAIILEEDQRIPLVPTAAEDDGEFCDLSDVKAGKRKVMTLVMGEAVQGGTPGIAIGWCVLLL